MGWVLNHTPNPSSVARERRDNYLHYTTVVLPLYTFSFLVSSHVFKELYEKPQLLSAFAQTEHIIEMDEWMSEEDPSRIIFWTNAFTTLILYIHKRRSRSSCFTDSHPVLLTTTADAKSIEISTLFRTTGRYIWWRGHMYLQLEWESVNRKERSRDPCNRSLFTRTVLPFIFFSHLLFCLLIMCCI